MVYDRLEWNMGNRWDVGRDRDGMEPVENWDNLFFDTCDIGRGIADRREGGDVIKGGSGG